MKVIATAVLLCLGSPAWADDSDDRATSTCEAIDVGDPIREMTDGAVPHCSRAGEAPDNAITTFDCANGQLHVMFTDENGRMLEGFVGEDEEWRAAEWRPEAGRTALQIECGG
jgi:hypothetical protein